MTGFALQDGVLDEAVVRRAAAGDDAAFARLVAEHHGSMARVAFVVAGDADLANDAVQAAWAIAWRRLGSLRDPSLVRPWLVSIAANQARDAIRHRRRRPVVDLSAAMQQPVDRGDPADWISDLDVHRALAALEPNDRLLVALRYVAGLDSGEIARQTGMSASGVRTRLSRVLARLRSEIDHV
jgi:RNA polymerase sigma-70 factor (ECF subfamily)